MSSLSSSTATKSGGATFTPRLPDGKRPQYPSFASVARQFLLETIRVGVITALLTLAVEPWYRALVARLMADPAAAGGGWGLDERGVFTVLACLAHTVTYVVVCGGMELMLALGFWQRFAFRRLEHQLPSKALVVRTLVTAGVGQLVFTPLLVYYAGYDAFVRFGMPSLDAPLPGFGSLFKSYTIAKVFNEFFFYWVHRIVHTKALYRVIHKQHHSYTGTRTIAAEFASLPETIFANTLPSIGGCLFFGSHPLVFVVWLVTRLQQTYEAHSGVCFVGTVWHRLGLTNGSGAAFHDFHHTSNSGNFGSTWLDWACGTMDVYLDDGGEDGYCRKWRGGEQGQDGGADAKIAAARKNA